jgi:WD40 repeat protein
MPQHSTSRAVDARKKVICQEQQHVVETLRIVLLQVMAYDVRSQEQLWTTQPGHTETIFDCCLHPFDPRLLATCSYDGSVRVWDVGSDCCLKTLDVPNSAGRESQRKYGCCWCQKQLGILMGLHDVMPGPTWLQLTSLL